MAKEAVELGRALFWSVVSVLGFFLIYYLFRWLGFSEIVSAAASVVSNLAPGAYDYLGRDLSGRKIPDEHPDDGHEEPLELVFDGRPLWRESDDLVVTSDFVSFAMLFQNRHPELANLFHDMTAEKWRSLSHDDPLAKDVLDLLVNFIQADATLAVNDELSWYTIGLHEFWHRLDQTLGTADEDQDSPAHLH